MQRTYRKISKPKGTADGLRLKIAVGFPEATFDKIAEMAVSNGHSFSHQVNLLCEAGMRE